MRNLYYCFIVLLINLGVHAQCINNGGFESGTASYVFTHRAQNFQIVDCAVNTGDGTFNTVTLSPLDNVYGTAAGTTVTAGFDPLLLTCNPAVSIDKVKAGSGMRAMKLNRSTGNSDITTMSQTFTASGTDISFSFSLIIQNPHPENMPVQPFFSVRVYDSLDNIISLNDICIVADIINPIFHNTKWFNAANNKNEDVLYTGWKCGLIKIPNEFVNKEVRLEFIMADCGQSGHFGTVYLDDITCDAICTSPAFGIVELNEASYNCPQEPFDVCGTYVLPEMGTLVATDMTLNIVQDGNVVNTILGASSLTSNNFCFTVNPSTDFGTNPSGDFELRANANFLVNGTYMLQVSDLSSSALADISIHNVEIINAHVEGNTLIWSDVADIYELEFFTDGSCCPGSIVNVPEYFHFTQTENSFNLSQIFSTNTAGRAMVYGCFRYRIRTECGWSPWCCIAIQSGIYDFPPGANWGNPLAPNCYEGPAADCASTLYEEDIVLANTVSYEQRDQWIKAVNTIQATGVAMYQAGEYIELLTGFNSVYGSLFQATIDDCTFGATQTQSKKTKGISSEGILDDVMVSNNENFLVYPNPFIDKITIIDNTDVYSYVMIFTIVDITGKEVLKVNNGANSKKVEINLTSLNSGVYFILGDGKVIQKIIKN